MEAILFLRKNHKKKLGGLSITNKINKEVIAIVKNLSKKKDNIRYVYNNPNSNDHNISLPDNDDYVCIPHIPLCLSRFIAFLSGESGLGKTSLMYYFIVQAYANITKKIYVISGKDDIKDDVNLKKLKYIKYIKGECLDELTYKQFKDSLVCFDDIDNWEFHKPAIKLMNNIVEKGRSLKINCIYISHLASKLSESPIYKEVNFYCTNNVSNNRMINTHLNLSDNVIKELEFYLKTDPFVCYNKTFQTIVTDKRIFKLNDE